MSAGSDPVLAAIGELGQRFGKLEGRFDKLEDRFDGIAEDLTRLRVDLMARLDRQQYMLTSVRNDIGVNMATADRVREANKTTRDDVAQLASQVSVIHRRLIQLEERFDRQAGP